MVDSLTITPITSDDDVLLFGNGTRSPCSSLRRSGVHFPKMRKVPEVYITKLSGDLNAAVGNRQRDHVAVSYSSTQPSQEFYGYMILVAAISYDEVKNQIVRY